jgi:DNA-binding XRE family transcriptional regulator
MSLIVDTLKVYTLLSLAAMGKRNNADIRDRFGLAVKRRREELGLTQEDLADRAAIHRTYLSDIERGTRNVSLINVASLAAALRWPISKLFQLVERI